MIAHLIAVRQADRVCGKKERWRPEGRPVRPRVITWPTIVVLAATFAAAACLIGDCARGARTRPGKRVGHAGTVHSIAYRQTAGSFHRSGRTARS